MKKTYYTILLATIMMGTPSFVAGQEMNRRVEPEQKEKNSKAWEIGIGGSVFQFSRTHFTNFNYAENKEGYTFDLRLKHVVYGANLYFARELSKHLYLDLQGTAGLTTDWVNGKEKTRMLYQIGPGLQWRLGEYFGSKYIDPYLRVGANYMYKGFNIDYVGLEKLSNDEINWIMSNFKNKDGADRTHLIPISLGCGVNMWLNDRFGLGFQGDYLAMPYKNVANSLQGTVRLMWRIGGKSKKTKPVVEYVDVERIVERIVPVEVEKIVKVPAETEEFYLCELFNNIYFDFDKDVLTPESEDVVEKIALILMQDTSKKYLITGYTDAKGSSAYNLDLSNRRAARVISRLIEKGVSSNMVKSVGVGKRISHMTPQTTDKVREGDRKVTVEIITNMDYWNKLP